MSVESSGPGRKNTDLEVAQRREEVRRLIGLGQFTIAAARDVAERYGVSFRMVWEHDKPAVLAAIAEELGPEHRSDRAAEWHARVLGLYTHAVEQGDNKTAATLLGLMGKALDVFAPKKVEHSGSVDVAIDDDHLRRAIAEELAGMGQEG